MSITNNNHIVSPPPSAGDFIKNKPCLCFRPEEHISAIIEKMRENHSYAAAVTEHEKIMGLLTGQEILIRAAAWRIQGTPTMESVAKAFNVMKAADVMIRNPVTVEKEVTLDDAMRVMIDNGFRYLPVVNGDSPIGILNIIDVVKFMEEKARLDNKTKDEILSYVMNHENYGCVSKD